MDAIGALWEKKDKNGKTFYSGQIEISQSQKINVVCFQNDKGDNPKKPDYKIFKSEPRY
jgi:hypothetical protein